jgi:hypothetical protein
MSDEKRIGRPPKPGEREQAHFWMRVEVKAAAVKAAAERGMNLTDFIAQLVVDATGVTVKEEVQQLVPRRDTAA